MTIPTPDWKAAYEAWAESLGPWPTPKLAFHAGWEARGAWEHPPQSSAPDPDGWIEWKGGECPPKIKIGDWVRFRDGKECTIHDQQVLYWNLYGSPSDIIAYRLHQPEQASRDGSEQAAASRPDPVTNAEPGGARGEPRTQFAWLIEAPGPCYLGVRKAPGDYRGVFYWTSDANRALRFFNKEQTDLSLTAIRVLRPDLWSFTSTLGEAWPREHGWLS